MDMEHLEKAYYWNEDNDVVGVRKGMVKAAVVTREGKKSEEQWLFERRKLVKKPKERIEIKRVFIPFSWDEYRKQCRRTEHLNF